MNAKTIAWLAAVPNSPSSSNIFAVDNFFNNCDLHSNSNIDRMFLFKQSDQANTLVSLFNPISTNAVAVSSPTFLVNDGYQFSGSNYIDTNFIPSTDGVYYTKNDATMSIYSSTNSNVNFFDAGALKTGVGEVSIASRFGGLLVAGINNIGEGSPIISDSLGLKSVKRTVSNQFQIWDKNTLLSTETAIFAFSTNKPNISVFVGGLNIDGVLTFGSTRKLALFIIGGALNITSLDADITQLLSEL